MRLFDEEEQAWYGTLIPTLDVTLFRSCIEKDLATIRYSTTPLSDFLRFKVEMLQQENEWKLTTLDTTIFDWTVKVSEFCSNKPVTYHIDIRWHNLENRSSRYFQVWMALQNVWHLHFGEPMSNLWSHIPNIPQTTSSDGKHFEVSKDYCENDFCWSMRWHGFELCPKHLVGTEVYQMVMKQNIYSSSPLFGTSPEVSIVEDEDEQNQEDTRCARKLLDDTLTAQERNLEQQSFRKDLLASIPDEHRCTRAYCQDRSNVYTSEYLDQVTHPEEWQAWNLNQCALLVSQQPTPDWRILVFHQGVARGVACGILRIPPFEPYPSSRDQNDASNDDASVHSDMEGEKQI